MIIGLQTMSVLPTADPRSALSGGRCVFRESRFLARSSLLSIASFVSASQVPRYVYRSFGITDISLCSRYSAARLSLAAIQSPNENHGN